MRHATILTQKTGRERLLTLVLGETEHELDESLPLSTRGRDSGQAWNQPLMSTMMSVRP